MRWDRQSTAALVSVGVNLLLVLLKLLLAMLSGSLALLADAFHSGSDAVVSLIVFLGFKISDKKTIAPRLGGKIENIIAIIISILIWCSAYVIFRETIVKKVVEIKNLPVAILGTLVSISVTYFLAHYKIHVGRATDSPSLVADGSHSKTDVYSSIAVLLGLAGYMIGLKLDTIVAAIVGVVILLVGFEIFKSGIQALLTKSPFQFNRFQPAGVRFINIKWVGHYSGAIKWLIAISLIFVYLSTGLYIVEPGEKAIVQKFGRIVKQEVMPGIHYRFPFPFESSMKLSTRRINRLEIGFRTRERFEDEPAAYLWETLHARGRYEKRFGEALMLTGDQSIVDVDIVIQYRIKDMVDYLLSIDAPYSLLRGVSEAAVRYVVGKEDIETLLTESRPLIEEEIQRTLQGFLDTYASGIQVMQVGVSEIHPPIEIVPAFRSVANAGQDKERYIREAESYLNEIVPLARAEAAKLVEEAEAYKISKINSAEGEAYRFVRKVEQYENAQDITSHRIYLETMEKVLSGTNKFILRPSESKDILDFRTDTKPRGVGKR